MANDTKTTNECRFYFKQLSTARLNLRAFEQSDLQAVYDIFSDVETLKYWFGAPVENLEAAQAILDRELELAARNDVITWGIALRESNLLIGKCTLFNYFAANQRAEIGYILNRRHWGKGYMNEVMSCVLEHAFSELALHRIEADTDPENVASLGLLAKYGFEREGLFKERWKMGDRWADSVMLGLLNH